MRAAAVLAVVLLVAGCGGGGRSARPAHVRLPRQRVEEVVRAGLSRRLHVLEGVGRWQVAARCVMVPGSAARAYHCATWSQNLVRSRDFWATRVVVSCVEPGRLCDWRALSLYPLP